VDQHFIGLLEKGHRPSKYPKTIRLQVGIKVLPGIPFFKNTEFIFILHTRAKVATPAPILCPLGTDQGYDGLGQLLALLSKNLHSYDDPNHAGSICNWPANNYKKTKSFGSCINNEGLDQWESSAEKGETICLASIFGGTSID
jgi:hypothetical protein